MIYIVIVACGIALISIIEKHILKKEYECMLELKQSYINGLEDDYIQLYKEHSKCINKEK
jgi:hypothetical protein